MKRGSVRVTLGKSDVAVLDVLRANCVNAVTRNGTLTIDPIMCSCIVEAINPIMIRPRRKR